MQFGLTAQQLADQAAFAAFADAQLVPGADRWDREERLPDEIVTALGAAGWLVATLPVQAGGAGLDMLSYGLLATEIGRGCGSVRNLIAVQGMVAHAIARWGTAEQADRWVPRIACGAATAAFALTEPAAGSDARGGSAVATRSGSGYVLTGSKKWISFGQRASLFLVFARLAEQPAAFVVERDSPGLVITPIRGLLGLRASELAEVAFADCEVPAGNLISHDRLTFDLVAMAALDYGRYSTACGCLGLAQACLDASLDYARNRVQFGAAIAEHQLVQRLLTDMISGVESARLLCWQAGAMRAAGHRDAIRQTLIAKYAASRAAFSAAESAVQLHGANGIGSQYPVQRYLRDAKVQEIIEGTSQIQQIQIADLTIDAHAVRQRPRP